VSGRFVFQDENIIHHEALWQPWRRGVFPRSRRLVWFTYWLDAQAFGRNASLWRLTSFGLHVANSLLLSLISPLAALLFFVHPLTVMGHSYVSGRSAQLQTLATLLAIIAMFRGHPIVALAPVVAASLWIKEDSVVLFGLWMLLWSVSP
jgi:hypothetical protein